MKKKMQGIYCIELKASEGLELRDFGLKNLKGLLVNLSFIWVVLRFNLLTRDAENGITLEMVLESKKGGTWGRAFEHER